MLEHFNLRTVLRIVFLTLALGVLALPLTPASPARAEDGAEASSVAQASGPFVPPKKAAALFGLDDGGVLYTSETTRNIAAETRVKWVRSSVEWDQVEAVRGTYNFTGLDYVLNPLIEKGFTPVVYVGENPSWAANTHCGPIDTTDSSLVQSFRNLMGALAARYPKVKVWALYNEMDFEGQPDAGKAGCFGTRTPGGLNNNGVRDVDEYAILLATAWKAVKKANPQALVGTGALAFDNFNPETAPVDYPGGGAGGHFNYHFLDELAATMKNNPRPAGEKFMDLVLFNYYDLYGTYYWKKQAAGEGIQSKAAVIRQKLAQANIKGVKLFVSETGSESFSNGQDGQARCVTYNLVRGAAAKLKGVVWWTFRDHDDSLPTWKYGVVDMALQRKMAFYALQTLTTELDNYGYKGTESGQPDFKGIEAYRFGSKGKSKYFIASASILDSSKRSNCVWTRNERTARFNANKIRVVTYLGQRKNIRDNTKKDLDPAVGRIAIQVGTDPLFVTIVR